MQRIRQARRKTRNEKPLGRGSGQDGDEKIRLKQCYMDNKYREVATNIHRKWPVMQGNRQAYRRKRLKMQG